MKKYICNSCGYSAEFKDASEVTNNCPVCKHGIFVSEKLLKEHEEMQEAIEHEGEDEILTPIQDAREAEKEQKRIEKAIGLDFIIMAMKKNIDEVGNERTYKYIEEEKVARRRILLRQGFLLAGGQVLIGEAIKI